MSNFRAPLHDPATDRRTGPRMYPCRTPGCSNQRATAKLVCSDCWWNIPPELRTEIQQLWRAYVRGPSTHALNLYQDAKARALAAAAQKVPA